MSAATIVILLLCLLLIGAMFVVSALLDVVFEYERGARALRDKMSALAGRTRASVDALRGGDVRPR